MGAPFGPTARLNPEFAASVDAWERFFNRRQRLLHGVDRVRQAPCELRELRNDARAFGGEEGTEGAEQRGDHNRDRRADGQRRVARQPERAVAQQHRQQHARERHQQHERELLGQQRRRDGGDRGEGGLERLAVHRGLEAAVTDGGAGSGARPNARWTRTPKGT